MSTHTVRTGPVICCYYRFRSTAGSSEACKGVMVSSFEVESTVLSEIGAGQGLTSKAQEGLVREAVRKVVYDAVAGTVRID